MNEVQNFANFHTCYLPYGLKFFHKGHPKHKLNYSWPSWSTSNPDLKTMSSQLVQTLTECVEEVATTRTQTQQAVDVEGNHQGTRDTKGIKTKANQTKKSTKS